MVQIPLGPDANATFSRGRGKGFFSMLDKSYAGRPETRRLMVFQPFMGTVLAVHARIDDAFICHSPYFWSMHAIRPTTSTGSAPAEVREHGRQAIGGQF
jgi:hypothetical protein